MHRDSLGSKQPTTPGDVDLDDGRPRALVHS